MSLIRECPFCGAKDNDLEFETDPVQGRKWGFIRCRQCECRGPEVRTRYWDTEEARGAAIGEWNKRA